MEVPIIIGVESDCVSGLFVTVGSFVVKRRVKSKNVVSVPSVHDISITYSDVVFTSILECSDKIKEASENESTSKKMKTKIPQCRNNSKIP